MAFREAKILDPVGLRQVMAPVPHVIADRVTNGAIDGRLTIDA
jgi:hypothetical protein